MGMALTEADMANPPPVSSRIPEESLNFAAHLATPPLDKATAKALLHFRRAANYIAAGMVLECLRPPDHFELTKLRSDDFSREQRSHRA